VHALDVAAHQGSGVDDGNACALAQGAGLQEEEQVERHVRQASANTLSWKKLKIQLGNDFFPVGNLKWNFTSELNGQSMSSIFQFVLLCILLKNITFCSFFY